MPKSLIQKLERLSLRYSYRGLDWVTRLGPPITFTAQRTIVFDHFFSEPDQRNGLCNHLMAQAFLEIKNHPGTYGNLYNEGRIYRVQGQDPVYFSLPPTDVPRPDNSDRTKLPRRSRGKHLFLAITDKKVIDKGETLSGEASKQALLDGNAVIFDPSFKTVELLAESEYLIDTIWAPGFQVSHPTRAAIFENTKHNSPKLVIGKSGGLVFTFNTYFLEGTSKSYRVDLGYLSPGVESDFRIPLDNRTLDYAAKHVEGLETLLSHMRRITRRSVSGKDLEQYQKSINVW